MEPFKICDTYTTKSKIVECPTWKTKFRITAKYYLSSDHKNGDNRARKKNVTCELWEELRLPLAKRSQQLRPYLFCDLDTKCPYLSEFPEEIEV